MSKSSTLKSFMFIITGRIIFFYLIVGLICIPLFKGNEAFAVTKLRVLNRLMPPLEDLLLLGMTGKPLDKIPIDEYLFYYKMVTEYIPHMADGYYMQGYCLAKKDLLTEAVKAYQKSISLNPDFFWSYYNLGLVHLKLNHWEEASEAFKKAMNTSPEIAFKIMLTSKIFQQLMTGVDQPQKVLPNRLKIGYQDCYQLMMLSNSLKQSGNQKIPEQFYRQLDAKMF